MDNVYGNNEILVSRALVKVEGARYELDGTEIERIEVQSEGKVYGENGAVHVIYKETELTGMEGTTTILSVSDDMLEIKRSGNINSDLVFQLGKQTTSMYDCDAGSMVMQVTTDKLLCTQDDEGIVIELEYSVIMNNSFLAKNALTVNVMYH